MKYKRIYLQDGGDPALVAAEDITWCQDMINDEDTEYTLAAPADALAEAVEALRVSVEGLYGTPQHTLLMANMFAALATYEKETKG